MSITDMHAKVEKSSGKAGQQLGSYRLATLSWMLQLLQLHESGYLIGVLTPVFMQITLPLGYWW